MCYPVEGRAEMRQVVRALLSERALFVTTYRREKCEGVTLVPRAQSPRVRSGLVAHVVSWSGRYDRVIAQRVERPRRTMAAQGRR